MKSENCSTSGYTHGSSSLLKNAIKIFINDSNNFLVLLYHDIPPPVTKMEFQLLPSHSIKPFHMIWVWVQKVDKIYKTSFPMLCSKFHIYSISFPLHCQSYQFNTYVRLPNKTSYPFQVWYKIHRKFLFQLPVNNPITYRLITFVSP